MVTAAVLVPGEAWSSRTVRFVVAGWGQGQFGSDEEAAVGMRAGVQDAPGGYDAFTHAHQAEAAAERHRIGRGGGGQRASAMAE